MYKGRYGGVNYDIDQLTLRGGRIFPPLPRPEIILIDRRYLAGNVQIFQLLAVVNCRAYSSSFAGWLPGSRRFEASALLHESRRLLNRWQQMIATSLFDSGLDADELDKLDLNNSRCECLHLLLL